MRGELHARLAAALGARVKAHGIIDIDDLAQVAIDTIREPTQAMETVGEALVLTAGTASGCYCDHNPDPLTAWRAMVDAER